MSDIKILVVEDDAIEALDIKRTLNSFGYSVPYVASRGEEAISKSLELMPDLILMDIILKGKTNGIEAASKIKDLNIPVIYLTAHSEESTVKKAKLTEPYGYLIKPYDIFELKFAIELALFKSNQEKKLKESEANFRAIAENASEGILIAIKKGTHSYANQMAAEITGYSVEELLKNGIADLAHKDEIKKLMGRYNKRISGKTVHPTYETKIVGKEGNIIPIEITAAKTVWKGQPADMVIFRDISERKKVEKALKLAGLYNRSLIEASLDPLVTIGPDGKITDVNTATETVTGHTRDELIGTDFSNYFTEPDNARKGYEQVFKDGFVRDYPLEILNKDGHITSVLYNASVYRDESGDVVGVFAAARDITQRKEIEEKLKDSEERMRLTLEATQIGLWDWDVKNDEWYASPIYYSMLGYEPILGPSDRKEWLKRVHPDDRAMVKEKIDKVLNQNFNSYQYEARMCHADGTYRWVSVAGFSIESDPDGKATRMLGIRVDITQRKEAEEELKLAGLYNRSLIEASLDPLVTIGPDGKITDVNTATENATGYSRDELIGTDFSDYFTEPDKAREGYEHVFREGYVRDYPLEIQNQNGSIIPVLYNASVYRDESGDVVGVFAAARDITVRKKAEEKIQMLANVVESSDDAIITKSLEGRITSWNKGAELIYGYSAEEVLGKNISILAPPELKNELKHLIENIKHGEHVLHYETTRLRKDGKEINVSLTLSPILDSAGKLVGISTIARDTTQRKRDEEKLQRSEEKYRTLFEESFDGLFITSPDGKILDMNKKGIEMFGYANKEDILQLDLERDVYADPSDRKQILDMVNKQGSAEYEIVVKKKNGKEMVTYCSLTAVKAENGVINSYRGIIRDITKRKKDEDAILRAKEEWENTFDAVPDLIAILDTNYQVIRANKAMANRLGVNPEDAVGVTCYEVVHGLNEPPSFCPHSRLLEDGQDHTAEVHEDRIGGDFIVTVSPLYDSEGKLLGSVHVARDITDRKKAEDKVKKSLREKEILLSEIHHRVKNNMQIISSLLNLQIQYVTAEETADVLRESQDRVKAMATVYEKVYLSEDLTKVNFNSYIQSLVQGLFYSYLIKEDQITFLVEIEDILLNIETAIPCGLIISELVSNSLKHAFPGERKGEIKVSLKSYGEKYELLISDNGVGLPENVDFKNTNTLGLKLVNNLVDQIDGEINLERSNGTEFKITFKELEYKKRI
nr:PAS domain S-box protein [uncultured Methanobacterium sp.]